MYPKSLSLILMSATLSFVALSLDYVSYPVLAGPVTLELALTYTQSGLMMTIFAIFYALMQVPSGILSDKFGGGRVIALSTLVMGLSCVGFGVSSSFATALFCRLMIGAGAGFILPASTKLLSSSFPARDLDGAMGIFGSAFGIGFIISFAAIPWILDASNWRMGAAFTGIFTLVVTIPCWVILWRSRPRTVNLSEKAAPTGSTFEGLFSKSLVHSILINFTGLAVVVGITTWAPLYLTQSLNASLAEVGFMIAVLGVMMIVSSFAGGALTPKIGGGKVVIISMAMCVALPIVLIFTPSTFAGFLVMAAVGWAASFYVPPVFARVSLAGSREHSGAVFGVFNMLSFIGSSITPTVVGYILDTVGRYDIGFVTISVIAILGLIGSVLFERRKST
jgi:ACS family glucarate transporter-like MFS transporter